MFQRFFEEGLAQASFLIGCDRTHEAIVIDPRRDASIYAAAAAQAGATIVGAIETHVHADFVSGARELASSGARVIAGPGANLAFDHHEVRDGEERSLGDLTLTFFHTPGHTFEHVAVGVHSPLAPPRLFTGDLLFVGAVGRPDLVGETETRQLAGQLFDSLQRVMKMDGRIELHPGHGAGSLCGAGIGKEPSTTIRREADQNPLLKYTNRDEFIAAVMADLPDTPPYFARMKQVNQHGPDVLGLVAGAPRLASLKPAAAAALAADGAIVVDVRPGAAFAAGHPYGAINLAFGSKVGYWGGWVIPGDAPVILLSEDAAQARDAALQLLRVGLDRIEGVISGGYEGWTGAGLPTATLDQMPAADLRAAASRGDLHVVDVRSAKEFRAGHLDGAVNVPAGEITERAAELPAGGTIATVCEGGYRSMLAASLLAREGVARIINVTGGMAAVRALETT